MVTRIDIARTLNLDLDNGYKVEIAFIPAELPDDHPLRERHDARSIAVPATAGSLWMPLFTAGDQHYVGAAIFAADDESVRCATVDIR